MSGDEDKDGKAAGEGKAREPRLRDFARRILREVDERPERAERAAEHERHERHERDAAEAGREASGEGDASEDADRSGRRAEVREILSSLLATGNKTRAELIRLVAKEVRFYLEAAELDVMLHDLVTNYSLEVNASIHLKPLDEEPAPSKTRVGLKRRKAEAAEGDEDA